MFRVHALELEREFANHDSPRTKQAAWGSWRAGAMGSCTCAKGSRIRLLLSAEPQSLHAQQEKQGEAESWGDNWAPQNYSYTLRVSISLSVFHKTLVLPTRCSSNRNKFWSQLSLRKAATGSPTWRVMRPIAY